MSSNAKQLKDQAHIIICCPECQRVRNPNTGKWVLDLNFINYALPSYPQVEEICPECLAEMKF